MKSFASLQNKMIEYARVHAIPISGGFELTNRCNLGCRMCFVCQNTRETIDRELTAAQWIELGRQVRDAGLLRVLLTGGEALFRDDFWEIYEGLTRLGLLVTVNTNGVLLTEENVRRFVKMPPVKISVSVYGASPEAYQRITGSAAAFDKVRQGIERVKQTTIPLNLRSVLIRDTVPDIENIAEFILSYVDHIGIVAYVAPCREEFGKDPLSARLNAEELTIANDRLREITRTIADRKKKEGEDGGQLNEEVEEPIVMEEDDDELIPKELNPEMEKLFKDSAFRCLAARTAFWVNWEGHMTPCALAAEPYTFPVQDGFSAAWKKLVEATHAIAPCQDCVECEYKKMCSTCPVRLYIETGSYQKKADYLCQLAYQNHKVRQAREENNRKGDK